MKKAYLVLVIICYMLSVCICAHAEASDLNAFCAYWIGIDAETNGRVIMKSNNGEGSFPVMNMASGYLLEGGSDGNVYYADMNDNGQWEIYEADSGLSIATLEDSDIIRVLAYQNDTVFYIKSMDGIPVMIAYEKEHGAKCYPYGGYTVEFDRPVEGGNNQELDTYECEAGRTVLIYTTTISEDGKAAYCIDNSIAWQPENFSNSIYITTLNQPDLYVGEGSHPVWLDKNRLLYIGNDSKLYQYDVENQIVHLFVSDKNAEISLPSIDPEARMTVINENCIGYIQMQGKERKLVLLSLQTEKTQAIDSVNPTDFMDVIVKITLSS